MTITLPRRFHTSATQIFTMRSSSSTSSWKTPLTTLDFVQIKTELIVICPEHSRPRQPMVPPCSCFRSQSKCVDPFGLSWPLYIKWYHLLMSAFPDLFACCVFLTSFTSFDTLSVQFSSVAQSYPTLCDPTDCSTPGLPVHHQLPEFTQTHGHRVSDAIQPSHPLSSPSPPAPNPSQHQSLFQWVNSSHEVAKVLEFHSYLFIVSLPSAQNVSSVGAGSFVCFATDLCLEPRIFHGV